MKIQKTIMALGLLSLFMGVGYADSNVTVTSSVSSSKDALIASIKDTTKQEEVKEIYKFLENEWHHFDIDDIKKMISKPLTLENLSDSLGMNFTEEQEDKITTILVWWDEDLFAMDESVAERTKQNYAEADEYWKSADEYWKSADEYWKSADEYWKSTDEYEELWKTLDKLSSELKKL